MLSDRLRRRAGALFLVAVPALLAGAPALAQPASTTPPAAATASEKQSLARLKAEQGLKLFGAGRWLEAYDWFREADVLYHAPTLVLYMARCRRQADQLIEARALYEQIVAEPMPADARAAFVEAHDDARTELAALRPLVPAVQFAVTDAPRAEVRLMLDGAPLATDMKELDPGPHTLEVSGGNNERATRSFTVVRGPNPRVEIALHAAAAVAPPPPPILPLAPPPAEKQPGFYAPALVSFGVGAVGLVVGAVTGSLTLSQASAVKSQCQGNLCPASARADADAATRLGNVSTVGFVVGGLGAAAGVVLLVARPRDHAKAPGSARSLEWNAGVGPGRIELRGSF